MTLISRYDAIGELTADDAVARFIRQREEAKRKKEQKP